MQLIDALKGLLGVGGTARNPGTGFQWIPDSFGVSLCLPQAQFERLASGSDGNPTERVQYVVLKMLEEQGVAKRIANGFHLPSDAVVAIDDEQLEYLGAPPRNPGTFQAHFEGQTHHSAFRVRLDLTLPDGQAAFSLKGPFIELGGDERYLMRREEALALLAWDRHCKLPQEQRGTAQNLRLVAMLQLAKRSGMPIDLAHFDKLEVLIPDGVGVTGTKMPDGSLRLTPSFGDGSSPDVLDKRWRQIDLDEEGGILRVENRIIVLDAERLKGIAEVLRNRRIPAAKVKDFMTAPTAFLDGALVNLDLGFSVRVLGVGRMEHMEFGLPDAVRPDWFGEQGEAAPPAEVRRVVKSEEDLRRFVAQVQSARSEGATVVNFDGVRIDISDEQAIDGVIETIRQDLAGGWEEDPTREAVSEDQARERAALRLREAAEIVSDRLSAAAKRPASSLIERQALAREPFRHQEEGILWMKGLIEAALKEDPSDFYRLQGALLADDMGLGKTYMSLVGLAEYYRQQADAGRVQKPILVVAPLSLLENWEAEVASTFKASPFRDVVVLQSGRDLARFRDRSVRNEGRQLAEILQQDREFDEASIEYALTIGPESGASRLDMDRRLVLTTYQGLRDYQFSLCRIDWGLVIFDEAQNIKNPNALQTRAAKGLKADFKLLMTGTPVENSLGDFWCLMDTAQPGLLGDWRHFREKWIRPIVAAGEADRAEVRREVGLDLRASVGVFMLRRTKEEQLTGLPSKTVLSGLAIGTAAGETHRKDLAAVMSGRQLSAYDEVLSGYRAQRGADDGRGSALAALHALRVVSLHPRLSDPSVVSVTSASEAREMLGESAKLAVVLAQLERIKAQGEKVILFMASKRLQAALKIWLDLIFRLDIGIINGDTIAVSNKADAMTRKRMITAFEEAPGFNILIMSPVAAGVGLTVVGANHVIHVERHWNPAKEAQASDRVYRIGQKRDVFIYLPVALHPKLDAFDVNLDVLLHGKQCLKDAVMAPDVVDPQELMSAVGL